LKGYPSKIAVAACGKKDSIIPVIGLIILGGFWKETEKF
jgi:hypothetical protein